MISRSYKFDIITPCFCAGANPKETAEIRAPSIRGQLRWWFRVLGGFRSLAPMDLRDQESLIFGSSAGGEGRAGQLRTRVLAESIRSGVMDGQELGHRNFSDSAFLTFPIQSREMRGVVTEYNGRGVILGGSFELTIQWIGGRNLGADLEALISVFGNLGSLGFRGRRAMGAISPAVLPNRVSVKSLKESMSHFSNPDAIVIKALPANSAKAAISNLGGWLKSCRSHGRSVDNQSERDSPYFEFARRDHDIGYGIERNVAAFRPALGLPIIQRVGGPVNMWQGENGGRFASPVVLRPHRDAQNEWRALVIFVDARKWPIGKGVQIKRGEQVRSCSVSLDLYNAMKNDPRLTPYGG